MSDERLRRAFEVLEPTLSQRSRVEARVVTAWESRQRSLFTEWLDVLRGRPLVNGAWMLAAMAVLLLTTPIGGLLSAIPRAGTVAFTERVNSRSTSIERLAATLGFPSARRLDRSRREGPRRRTNAARGPAAQSPRVASVIMAGQASVQGAMASGTPFVEELHVAALRSPRRRRPLSARLASTELHSLHGHSSVPQTRAAA